ERPNMSVRPTTKFKRPITECAQCGERLLMPGWSENVDVRRVRHLWECKACDYAFETTVCYEVVVA
ncbi:MAG: hypothetical protein WBW28_11705, partial [Pseudolabrys sp.]